MEDSLTEGEKFTAKRLGGKKKKSSTTMIGLQLERRIVSYSLQGMRGGKGGTVDRCNKESVGVIS